VKIIFLWRLLYAYGGQNPTLMALFYFIFHNKQICGFWKPTQMPTFLPSWHLLAHTNINVVKLFIRSIFYVDKSSTQMTQVGIFKVFQFYVGFDPHKCTTNFFLSSYIQNLLLFLNSTFISQLFLLPILYKFLIT